jgi:hypothetical protein
MYCGTLEEFFAVVPQQFDIVYLDGCGPLLGQKPSTVAVLQELFLNQRLAPLSALITNVCMANMEGNASRKWAKRMVAWYAPRYKEPCYFSEEVIERVESHRIHQCDSENAYLLHVEKHLGAYYEDFVTRFIVEFTTHLLPWWRVVALTGASRQLFANREQLLEAVGASLRPPENIDPERPLAGFGHATLAPELYPYVWAVELAEEMLEPSDPLRSLLTKETLRSAKLGYAIRAVSLIRHFFESRVVWGDHNRQACSTEFAKAMEEFRWFDSEDQPWYRMFCDTPMPHLIADLCLGQVGYPYHTNANRLLRLTYQAKQTPMLTDVFVLDQARYLYDLVPPVSLLDKGLALNQAKFSR